MDHYASYFFSLWVWCHRAGHFSKCGFWLQGSATGVRCVPFQPHDFWLQAHGQYSGRLDSSGKVSRRRITWILLRSHICVRLAIRSDNFEGWWCRVGLCNISFPNSVWFLPWKWPREWRWWRAGLWGWGCWHIRPSRRSVIPACQAEGQAQVQVQEQSRESVMFLDSTKSYW